VPYLSKQISIAKCENLTAIPGGNDYENFLIIAFLGCLNSNPEL
jgi:hypothetical protein